MSSPHSSRTPGTAAKWVGSGLVLAATAVTTVALAAVAAPAGAATAPDPWTQPGSNAANSHDNLAEAILTPAKVASIKKLATIKASAVGANPGPCTSGTAGPVESGGNVYAITNNALVKANAATGATVWAKRLDPFGTTIWSTVAVANGLAIAGGTDCTSVSDPSGSIVALSAATGAPVWQRGPYPYGALVRMSVSGNYVLSEGTSDQSGYNVSVRYADSGRKVWGQNYVRACGGGPILVAGGNVLVNTCDYSSNGATISTLVAYTLGTGVQKWSRVGRWGLAAGDSDATTAKDVYVTNSHGYLTDLTPQTGAIKGVFGGTTHAVLAVGNSRLFTTCTAGVCAYSRSSRALLWSYHDTTSGLSAAVGGTVIYLSDGTVLQSETGALLRHLFTGNHVTVVADGHVYVGLAIYGT